MTLGSLLSVDQIIPEMHATERWAAIVELIDLLVAKGVTVVAGPELVRTTIDGDLVICLLEGGFTTVEHTLASVGRLGLVARRREGPDQAAEAAVRAETRLARDAAVVAGGPARRRHVDL